MQRITKIFQVKTNNKLIKLELGGSGVYYAFGYESEFTGYRICVFCFQKNDIGYYEYKIFTKDSAQNTLEYFDDDPLTDEIDKKIYNQFKNNSNFALL